MFINTPKVRPWIRDHHSGLMGCERGCLSWYIPVISGHCGHCGHGDGNVTWVTSLWTRDNIRYMSIRARVCRSRSHPVLAPVMTELNITAIGTPSITTQHVLSNMDISTKLSSFNQGTKNHIDILHGAWFVDFLCMQKCGPNWPTLP